MKSLLSFLLFCSLIADAQVAYNFPVSEKLVSYPDAGFNHTSYFASRRKLFQRNTGIIIGLQRGKSTSLELGGEGHWRKISLLKPHIIGATANTEYNFEDNVLGYKGGIWMKRGRVNLTYGVNVSYYTNFKEWNSFGIGPSVGFRFFGLHWINGYTFLTKDKTEPGKTPIEVNSLYTSLRYYFPVENKFKWDRKTLRKKRERKKESDRRKKVRKKERGESKSLWNIFKPGGKA